ncbi:hypothetical protein BK660_21925 [Pseudomonas brassicacearum]|uniref:N-acetyltransferase domain-containing protein n=1 Tax=Pseudomonas brassicacearum TaxID=930166 RepID=A0A423HXK8_9PSED|nr:hypothetical protein [Pseudomonas brassicacearum]RON17950.1 hypothetical protein BK660_21925 [Pseudomonas brassicacearum]
MNTLIVVPTSHIDVAWKQGAQNLGLACATSGGEITGDQLKMMLSRGERTLVRLDRDEAIAGWGVVGVEQLPNLRVLYIYEMYAPHGHFEEFFDELESMAKSLGCSRLRCAAAPAQARLYRMRCGFTPVYQVLEVEL